MNTSINRVFCWHLRKTYMLQVLQMHLIHVSPCGEKKKKAGKCNISDLAPYYTACFHFMPVSLFFHIYDFNNKSHILWNCFHGMCQSLEAISQVFMLIIFFPPPSVIAMVCQNFPITVCGNRFISANSIITCHFTISPVFHIYLPVMCICYYKENSRKSFIMLHNIVTFFEKLWRLILHILYTEVLSLNTKD